MALKVSFVDLVDADLVRHLDELERARLRLQRLDFTRLNEPELGHRVGDVLGLWDRLRSTISDVLAALPAEEE